MTIPSTHKVAILVRHDGTYHFETKTVAVPDISPTELLVRLSVSGVCGSDFHLAAGHLGPTCDILGHEGVGRVVKLGSAVDPSFINVGARVGLGWVRDVCEVCFCCQSPGGEARCLAKLCSGLRKDGTFAEYAVVPSRYVIRIPEDVPDDLVAPILCGGVTAYKAIKVSEAVPGRWMVISGAGGGVGALGVQFAKAMGYRVIAIDVGDAKKEYCLKLGAEVYYDAKELDTATVMALTGDGAAAVLVMANSDKAYQAALDLVAPYGTFVCVGIPPGDQLVSFHPTLGISKGVRIIGSAVGTRKDIWEAIEFVQRGAVKPAVEMATLDDLSDIAKKFGKASGKYVIRLSDEASGSVDAGALKNRH
ncbi:Alcohol dehydrogenase GroES-like domain-containing protein [Cladophialophora immunda]|nr:Alcohol dehydrogenase GroES-like domain-containing protein [Cladophialophora immunda]